MKKVQFSHKNFIKSYHYYSFPLGILASNQNLYKNWILGKFINIFCGEVLQYDEKYYGEWDIFEEKIYKNLYLYDKREISNFLKNGILNNYAIHLWEINEKYIPNSIAYNRFDYKHDILIIGYDNLSKLIKIVSTDRTRNLVESDISLELINKSFTNNTSGRIFKIKEGILPNVNDNEIISNIREYICPNNKNKIKYYDNTLNHKKDLISGIYALDKFASILKNKIYTKNYINSIILINEHKKNLFYNLNHLHKRKIIDKILIDKYKEIVKLSNILKYQYIKFILKPNRELELSLIKNLIEIIEIENKILSI